ncbi:MAG: SDR family oxidoreductase [Saprospiraceae bacterium]
MISNLKLLDNKKVIVVGGAGSLGQAAVQLFVLHSASILVADVNIEQNLYNHNDVHYLKTNVIEESEMNKTIEYAHNLWGKIDGLYHIAGGSGRKFGDGPLHEMTIGGWNHTLSLNLTSVMISNRAIIQYWLKNNSAGSIVNTGSVLASSPAPHFFSTHAYAAAKSGIEGFSKSIASYYSVQNIRVNVIAPGLIATQMSSRAQSDTAILDYIKIKQPLDGGRIGVPVDCAGAALFLLSDLSSFITGQVIHVDGGWSLNEGQW